MDWLIPGLISTGGGRLSKTSITVSFFYYSALQQLKNDFFSAGLLLIVS